MFISRFSFKYLTSDQIAVVRYRDGSVIDVVHQVKE
ncbi:hypothetical protein ATS25_07820 [Salmonella enterica]|nr:hypothetical protein [Salmonella enterica]